MCHSRRCVLTLMLLVLLLAPVSTVFAAEFAAPDLGILERVWSFFFEASTDKSGMQGEVPSDPDDDSENDGPASSSDGTSTQSDIGMNIEVGG